jgi:iron complex outermembrane receptor protein
MKERIESISQQPKRALATRRSGRGPLKRRSWVDHRSLLTATCAVLALAIGMGEAHAQDAPAASERANEPDEITVTARRRAENVQDVPISMTVVSNPGDTISASSSNASLTRAVPNMAFVDGGGLFGNTVSIRGVGSISPLSSDDTSVIFYLDEVPQSVYSIAQSMFDTERVEVLRGPQGTLFGRNTQGGAVSIVSKRPTFDRTFSLTGEVGSNGYGLGQFIANGGLVPGALAGRLAVRWNTFGGDIPNIAAGEKDGGLSIGAARGSLLFTPDNKTEALLTFNYGRETAHSPRFLLPDAPRFPVSATDPRTLVKGESGSVNLRVRHEFESFLFNSQTAIQRSRSKNTFDPTDALVYEEMPQVPGTDPTYAIAGADITRFDLRDDTILQEFRASSLQGSSIDWTAGVSYYRLETAARRDAHGLTAPFNTQGGLQDNHFVVNSFAIFGEITVPLTSRLKATFGLRGTHEEKKALYHYDGNGLPGLPASYDQSASLDDDFLTGRGVLSYNWSTHFMTYASVARGYVTPGFPAYSVNSTLAKPENAFPASTSWTYETGFKSKFLSDKIVLNGSTFLNDVKNGHLVFFAPSQAIFTTVALNYQTYGGELELTAKMTPDFDIFGGLGYTHAELRDVPADSFTGAKSGNRVPNVPAFSANIGADYRWSAASFGLPGNFDARATYQFVDQRAADIKNSFNLKSYGIVDARLTWRDQDISVYAFTNNLFDNRYQAWGQAFGTIPTVRAGQGRIVGIGASLQF